VRRLAFAFSLTASATVVLALVSLAITPDPFSASSVALISIGLLGSTAVTLSGFLLVRAPWGRFGLVLVVAVSVLVAATNGTDASYGALIIGAISIVGLAGPWLRFWVRQQPVPDGLNATVMALILVAPVAPIVVGVAAFDTAHWAQWASAFAIVTASFLFGRGVLGTLWLMRIFIPMASIPAILVSPIPTVFVLVGSVAVATAAAWMPSARQATALPPPVLPTPRPPRKEPDNASD